MTAPPLLLLLPPLLLELLLLELLLELLLLELLLELLLALFLSLPPPQAATMRLVHTANASARTVATLRWRGRIAIMVYSSSEQLSVVESSEELDLKVRPP